MRTVGTNEARTHLAGLLREVEKGTTITITRNGRAIAKLFPLAQNHDDPAAVIAELRAFRRGVQLKGSLPKMVAEGRL